MEEPVRLAAGESRCLDIVLLTVDELAGVCWQTFRRASPASSVTGSPIKSPTSEGDFTSASKIAVAVTGSSGMMKVVSAFSAFSSMPSVRFPSAGSVCQPWQSASRRLRQRENGGGRLVIFTGSVSGDIDLIERLVVKVVNPAAVVIHKPLAVSLQVGP